MRKVLSILAIIIFSLGAKSAMAQTNIQTHYNFGSHIYKDRSFDPRAYMTIEHFSMDKWGDNFFFVDLSMKKNSISEAYFEISRNLKFWEAPISLHLEYNGGLNQLFPIKNAYLAGVNWSYANIEKQVNVGVSMSYRYDYKHSSRPHNMQLTTTWGWTSWNRLFTISGFLDLWTNKVEGSKSNITLVSEPQFWLHLNQFQGVPDDFALSLGGELKVSYNFLDTDKFYVLPTLGLKWTFQ